jgi:hypothetical protein
VVELEVSLVVELTSELELSLDSVVAELVVADVNPVPVLDGTKMGPVAVPLPVPVPVPDPAPPSSCPTPKGPPRGRSPEPEHAASITSPQTETTRRIERSSRASQTLPS